METNNKPVISIGTSDFKKLRQAESLYLDKSLFICDILNDASEVSLITRPRRFGKTLNMSMLQYFFDIRDAAENKKLFAGLKVYKDEKAMAQQGSRPVIFLTFKDCKGNDWEHTKSLIDGLISAVVKNIQPLIDKAHIHQIEKEILLRLQQKEASFDESIRSIALLTELLVENGFQPPLILIDEYDVPLQNAWLKGFWDEAVSFMSCFFCAALKDNVYLWRAILSGCLRISKESIFSDLNNITIYSILSKQYSEYFGLMVNEVDDLLKMYGLEDKTETVREWYDGYNFGENTIYNPWSVLNWIKDGGDMPHPYWANTSGNELVRSILFRTDEYVKQQLSALLNNETIEIKHREHLVFREIENSSDNIWSFLFSAGYLKSVGKIDENGKLRLKIPNREVLGIFTDSIRDWFSGSTGGRMIGYIGQALRQGQGDDFAEYFRDMIDQSFSYFDLGGRKSENFYHAFCLGLIVHLSEHWQIKSNREAGYGRADILMFPKNPKESFGVIMELKVSKTAEALQAGAEDALKQIEKRNYAQELQNSGAEKILKIGIAFCGKKLEIRFA